MNLEEQFIFGQEAEKVIKNKAYIYAMTALKGECLNKIQDVSMLDDAQDKRNELIRKLQIISEFESEIEGIMENGRYAQSVLDRNKTTKI